MVEHRDAKGDSWTCPFRSEAQVALSEVTWDTEVKCGLLQDDCWEAECPLKKAGTIVVHWNQGDEEHGGSTRQDSETG